MSYMILLKLNRDMSDYNNELNIDRPRQLDLRPHLVVKASMYGDDIMSYNKRTTFCESTSDL